MKLVRFRVKNYKSIVDSGDCYVSDKLTILAGKNECGKTSLLEALEDFHEDRKIRAEAEPIDGEQDTYNTQVFVTFNLTVADQDSIYEVVGNGRVAKADQDITLYRYLGSKGYFLSSETRQALGWQNVYNQTLLDVKKSIAAITSQKPPKLDKQTLTAYKAELATFKANNPAQDVADGVDVATVFINGYLDREVVVQGFVNELVKSHLPYFILFSSFDDSFPDSIPITELATNEWASDLEHVSSFNKATIASTNAQKQYNHQGKVNADFTDKFKRFWTQDPISLEVSKDGDNIYFWVNEGGIRYKPSQRSKGQQWYLSFYIRIVARITENKPNIILIDEPGLFLHAKAQKDLLRVLADHTSSWPVIFSTHSPYLITEENLENIRLVEKKNRKTTVLGKVHAHETADKETLTPILTAIGLGVNDSITNLDQKDNAVVEGPEDVFYLQAFKLLLPDSERPKTNFVNGGGAGNMGVVGAILEGWGCSVIYLYDNDQGAKDGTRHLRTDWKVLPESIKTVMKTKDSTIADVLSSKDFKMHVLQDSSLSFTEKNSAYIKKKKLEKVLLARQFLQRVKSHAVEPDAATLKNIRQLFSEINIL